MVELVSSSRFVGADIYLIIFHRLHVGELI